MDEGKTEAEAVAGVIEGLEMLMQLPEELAWWERPRIRQRLTKLKKRELHANARLSADEGNRRVQELIDQGMREDFAVAEVMKRMKGDG